MKNFFKSRGFIITTLSVLCIAVLGICWYVGRDKTEAFIPDESPPATVSSEWDENGTKTEAEAKSTRPSPSYPATAAAETEAYPKVEKTDSEETVVSFTPTEKPKETTPPAPEGKTILKDPGPAHPINPTPAATEAPAPTEAPTPTETPAPAEPPAPTEPPAGSTNQNGAVYDPVFGWVVPSEVIQSTIDSDGDPNKMVGNMD